VKGSTEGGAHRRYSTFIERAPGPVCVGEAWRKVKPERRRGLTTFTGPDTVSIKVKVESYCGTPPRQAEEGGRHTERSVIPV